MGGGNKRSSPKLRRRQTIIERGYVLPQALAPAGLRDGDNVVVSKQPSERSLYRRHAVALGKIYEFFVAASLACDRRVGHHRHAPLA